jgi:hypothetical protein
VDETTRLSHLDLQRIVAGKRAALDDCPGRKTDD